MGKSVSLAIFSVFLMLGSTLFVPATASPPTIKRLDELYSATIEGGSPETVDPAWCFDTASAELIFNVYETLIFFDGEQSSMYIPQLATEWTVENITGAVSPEGLPWYFRYTFKIREGVHFHNESFALTPADVEYSFERAMVQDRAGGPTWMFYEPLLNAETATDLGNIGNATNPGPDVALVGKMIDHAVESNETHVWFNLAFPGAYGPFLQVLAQSWSSILSKQWVNGYVIGTLGRPDWNGEWGDYTNWINYRLLYPGPPSPLDNPTSVMCGTGPYKFVTLDYTNMFWSVERFDSYWRGWPASYPAPPYPSDPAKNIKPAGYVTTANVTWAYDWTTRKAMFLAGDVDFCAVSRQYIGEIVGQPGIRCIYPLQVISVDSYFYTFDINATAPYGKINDYGVFTEDGIPRDFFGNAEWGNHVRLACAYCFDSQTYLKELFLGEAVAPATAIIPSMPYCDPSVPGYTYNLTAAEEEFKKVPSLSNTGFTLTLPVSTGSTARKTYADFLQAGINALNNTKYHVNIVYIDWRSFMSAMLQHRLAIFSVGWVADYADPHDIAYPFYYSNGTFAAWQKYSNPAMDALIDSGVQEYDPAIRRQIYHDIQVLARQDTPSVPLDCPIARHFERDWVVGWYYNAVAPGNYFYNLWKWYYVPHSTYDTCQPYEVSNRLPSDVNYDGKVDMKDIGWVCKAYGSYYGPPLHARWNFRCDVSNDRKVDMKDVGYVCRDYGKTSTTP